jgi:hypothetical protein
MQKNRCISHKCLRNFFCEDDIGGQSGLNIGGGKDKSSRQNMPPLSPPKTGVG